MTLVTESLLGPHASSTPFVSHYASSEVVDDVMGWVILYLWLFTASSLWDVSKTSTKRGTKTTLCAHCHMPSPMLLSQAFLPEDVVK